MRWLPAAIVLACSLHAADAPPDAKTFALLVGISKYEKLPQDPRLQDPDADVKTFADYLASGRGGGVPTDRMLLLTNEQATTAALRDAFRGFLKRPGKTTPSSSCSPDTVPSTIAAHISSLTTAIRKTSPVRRFR